MWDGMHRTRAARGPCRQAGEASDQAEGGRSAGKTVADLASDREQGQRSGHCHENHQWRLADETAFGGRTRGAAELQAQVALRVLMAWGAVEPMCHVSGRREEQRDERKQGKQAMAARGAHAVGVGVWRSAEAQLSVAAGRHPGNSPIIRGL
jgi:hypothetical protein